MLDEWIEGHELALMMILAKFCFRFSFVGSWKRGGFWYRSAGWYVRKGDMEKIEW